MRAQSVVALLAALWLTALAAHPVQADEGWTITAFASSIDIRPDATLRISENIHVDFGGLQKHGIFRTIPLRYRYDDTHDRYYDLSVISVTDGTHSLPYTTSIQSDNEVIQIGDPNVLVTGARRYLVTYQVTGAMNSFAERDELFWNVDGALWPVPKRSVTAVVSGVPATSIEQVACYQGPTGSTDTCTAAKTSNGATFASRAWSTSRRRCSRPATASSRMTHSP